MRLNSVDIKAGIALVLLGCVSVVLYRSGVGLNGVSGIRFFMTVAFIQSAIYLLAALIGRSLSSFKLNSSDRYRVRNHISTEHSLCATISV